ncbi:MAG TPA: NAD(P)/FAD-dependent oxidoreductase [Candidatus Eisenbacteria bacterium]|nr:NAD(P)/FAD-dependent oxidoreductase [Candidatus Eisenbacteria bacterium]
MADPHRVLILGGGFAGLVAAQTLKRANVEITLLDKRNFHLFQPLLYQVATGSLSPAEIAAPLRAVFSRQKNVEVLLGEAVDIDPAAKRVLLADGGQFPYDTLIIATGSQTSYYGNDQWRQCAPALKTVEEAVAMRHKLLYAFERAERAESDEEARAWLNFVIIGAGATGLELAGALAEIAQETLKHDFRRIRPQEARIVLMEGGPRVLGTYPANLSAKAEKLLKNLGVEVMPDAMATGIDDNGVSFKRGDTTGHIPARTVFWAGGVTATPFARRVAERLSAETDRTGRFKVNADLTLPSHPEIFVLGDLALSLDEHGEHLPGVAQVAIQGGRYAGKAIRARLAGRSIGPFRYFNKGDMAVIGRAAAVANIFGFHISGFPAWFVWVFIHLLYIVEFQSRILVMIQWGFLYLSFSRNARLITGGPVAAPSTED